MVAPVTPPVDFGALTRIGAASEIQRRAGACTRPVFMAGSRLLIEADTGRVLDHAEGQRVGVRCRNRRAAVCPSCAGLYRLDAFHLFAAGLRGGKNTPAEVAGHPRLFVTLTAPSCGPVHLGPGHGGALRRCHPRRGCGRWHPAGDPAVGAALDPAGYDYAGQVLFNAYAGQLWARFTIDVRRHLAATAGLTRTAAARQVRVVFAKVTEFQARGVVHTHAIVRLDGSAGPGTPAPNWASVRRLETAIRRAATTVQVTTPSTRRVSARTLRWGTQIDVRRIGAGGRLPDVAVAGYVAKYATKATEKAGIDIRPLHCRTCDGNGVISGLLCRACSGSGRRRGTAAALDRLSPHVRALVDTCWRLGGQPEYAGLRLRRWAHQLGFRGHFASKSLTYSTTFAALRAERRAWHRSGQATRLGLANTPLLAVGDWRYTGRDTDRRWPV
ncbi:replication initiator [Actinoplanes cyaneus]|nr:replication initiator [Actinoplanes cyaneus]